MDSPSATIIEFNHCRLLLSAHAHERGTQVCVQVGKLAFAALAVLHEILTSSAFNGDFENAMGGIDSAGRNDFDDDFCLEHESFGPAHHSQIFAPANAQKSRG